MDLELISGAIVILEAALIEAEDEEIAVAMVTGRMGARLMGMLEEDADLLECVLRFLDDDDGVYWEKVEVDVDGFRRMGDPSFKRHFRLSKPTFEVLLETLANFLMDSGKVVRVRNPIDIPLLMVLWILASQDTFRSVAVQFGYLPGEVYYHYSYIIEALREMGPLFVQWPNEQERVEIEGRFLVYSGMPGVAGAVDGTFNTVTAPLFEKNRYRNRHHQFAYNSMVICDDNLLIRDMHIGEVGSMHDSRVFRRSPLYQRLLHDEENELLAPDQHIIGDKAYTLTDFVMTPFRNRGNLTPEQRAFNYALCRSRARIEHCFGKAFMQWRRMKMLHVLNHEIAIDHITACFVLHNFMILNGEQLIDWDDPTLTFEEGNGDDDDDDDEDEDRRDDEDDPDVPMNQLLRRARARGREKRNELVNVIYNRLEEVPE
ncbi:putative nuclease HARBI1 [Thrips palmi]|uniref:Nuclease HARBI1 n=1 Tax=Thrips palmi TaxID=161013 RepID=A0A6P9A6Y9_THRPL|nr:putative nuclease HARBI1 [Thrips palmi]